MSNRISGTVDRVFFTSGKFSRRTCSRRRRSLRFRGHSGVTKANWSRSQDMEKAIPSMDHNSTLER